MSLAIGASNSAGWKRVKMTQMQLEDDGMRVLSIVQGLIKPVFSVVIYQTITMLWYSKYMFDKLWQQKAFPAGVPKSSDFSLALSTTFVVALGLHALLASILSCVHTLSDKILLIVLVAHIVAILPSVDYAFAQRGYLWFIEAGRNVACILAVGFSMLAMDEICQLYMHTSNVHSPGGARIVGEL